MDYTQTIKDFLLDRGYIWESEEKSKNEMGIIAYENTTLESMATKEKAQYDMYIGDTTFTICSRVIDPITNKNRSKVEYDFSIRWTSYLQEHYPELTDDIIKELEDRKTREMKAYGLEIERLEHEYEKKINYLSDVQCGIGRRYNWWIQEVRFKLREIMNGLNQ